MALHMGPGRSSQPDRHNAGTNSLAPTRPRGDALHLISRPADNNILGLDIEYTAINNLQIGFAAYPSFYCTANLESHYLLIPPPVDRLLRSKMKHGIKSAWRRTKGQRT